MSRTQRCSDLGMLGPTIATRIVLGIRHTCRSSLRQPSCDTSTSAAPAIKMRIVVRCHMGQGAVPCVPGKQVGVNRHSTECHKVSGHVNINGKGEDVLRPRQCRKLFHEVISLHLAGVSAGDGAFNSKLSKFTLESPAILILRSNEPLWHSEKQEPRIAVSYSACLHTYTSKRMVRPCAHLAAAVRSRRPHHPQEGLADLNILAHDPPKKFVLASEFACGSIHCRHGYSDSDASNAVLSNMLGRHRPGTKPAEQSVSHKLDILPSRS